MWSRSEIKSYARDFLKRYYLKAFLVCLIALMLGGGGIKSSPAQNANNRQHHSFFSKDQEIVFSINNPLLDFGFRKFSRPFGFKVAVGSAILLGFLLTILYIAVGNIIEVGKVRFFLKGFKEEADIGDMFSVFNSEEYLGIFKTQFLRGLYNFLWTLLFIIPGIIKSYEYKMVPYILSEDPNIPAGEAIRESRSITDGHKWNMFVLDLSFLGWYLLGALLFGIGGLFVNPYEEATYARLYNILAGNDDNEINIDYEISE